MILKNTDSGSIVLGINQEDTGIVLSIAFHINIENCKTERKA